MLGSATKFYNLDATKQYNASRYEVAVKASDAEINEMLGINQKGTSVRVTPNDSCRKETL